MGKRKKIDWLNHGLEFVVVIIGILIAFQLNTCSQDSSNRKNIKTHLNQIEEETSLNSFYMNNGIKYSSIEIAKIDTLISLLESGGDRAVIDRLASDIIYYNGIYIRKNAYNSIIESGDFTLIDDIGMKQNIINLYEYYRWVESINLDAFDVFNTEFYPYVQEHYDRKDQSFDGDSPYTELHLRNILYSYQSKLKLRLEKLKSCVVEMEKYLDSK